MVRKVKDLSGQKFERWTVVNIAYREGVKTFWCCICDCGSEGVVRSDILKNAGSRSCGCLATDVITKHGHRRSKASPEYASWRAMKQRCYNVGNLSYKNYGAVGVTVCFRWRNSFENFLSDMGERPFGTSLERIDRLKGYDPENCVWATPKEQTRNRSNARFVNVGGVENTVYEWAGLTGIMAGTIYKRLEAGWSPAEAVGLAQRIRTRLAK